jgi:hypothetical protein
VLLLDRLHVGLWGVLSNAQTRSYANRSCGAEVQNGDGKRVAVTPTEADANDLDTARSALGEIAFNRCGNYVTNY